MMGWHEEDFEGEAERVAEAETAETVNLAGYRPGRPTLGPHERMDITLAVNWGHLQRLSIVAEAYQILTERRPDEP